MDLSTHNCDRIYDFVDTAMFNFEGVLIHSFNGRNRCCVAALVFFMRRYRWGLIKTLEFLNAKKPGLELTASLLKKLLEYEKLLEKRGPELSKDWHHSNSG